MKKIVNNIYLSMYQSSNVTFYEKLVITITTISVFLATILILL